VVNSVASPTTDPTCPATKRAKEAHVVYTHQPVDDRRAWGTATAKSTPPVGIAIEHLLTAP
jgi:hypothetical protein